MRARLSSTIGMVLAAATAVAGGCAKGSLKDPDPGGRLTGIEQAVESNDRSTIPDLITLLDSDDAAVRLFSIQALEKFTGQTFGYEHAAPERERKQAVERWTKWYEEQEKTASRG